MRQQGRLMGLDYGEVRLGVALSDPLGLFAHPHSIITRASRKEQFADLVTIIEQSQVVRIIVGLPTNSTGGIGPQAAIVVRWARKLAEVVDLPIVLWDESYSSEDALAIQRTTGRRIRKDDYKHKPLDDIAAAAILQDYLDAEGARHEPGQTLEAFEDIE